MDVYTDKGGSSDGMHYDQWAQCAEADWENGVYSIPLKWKRKTPVNKGWPDLRLGPGDFPDFIKPPCNRGRLLGIAPPEGVVGGWVVCVDLDTEAARLLAEYFLPPTGEIGGRTSRPRAHYFYECNLPPRTLRFRDGGNHTILDMLSTGSQVLVKPSIHPSGEPYQWDVQGTRGCVDAGNLVLASGMLAATCLLTSVSASTEQFHKHCKRLTDYADDLACKQLQDKIDDPGLRDARVFNALLQPCVKPEPDELNQVVRRAADWLGSTRSSRITA